MNVVIDARLFGTGWTGVGRYTEELLRNLQELDTQSRYTVLLQQKNFAQWQPKYDNWTKALADFGPYTPAEQTKLPGILKRLNPDVVHFTFHSVPVMYRGNHVTTVHDLTLLDYKNVRGNALVYEAKYQIFKRVIRAAATESQTVLVPTEHGKQQLMQRFGVPDDKVVVTYEAVSPAMASPAPIERLGIKGPFLLHVGNAYPYKNLRRLVEAHRRVLASHPDLKLVLVGRKDYFFEQIEAQVAELGLQSNVICTGYVSEGELASLYRQAEMFVLPSMSEGFGLPALEAMAHGTAVMAANASCIPEVCGDAAEYFNPWDSGDLAEKIIKLMSDKDKLEDLRRRGPQHVRKYSWERMAQQTLEVYKRLAGVDYRHRPASL